MIKINLAPPEGRPRRAGGGPTFHFALPEFNFGLLFAVVYAVAVVALGGWWWQLSSREAQLAVDIKQATVDLEGIKAKIGQAGKIKETVAELKKRIVAIQELTKGQQRPVVLFDALADVVPRDLWLNTLEERGTTIRITGTSYSTTAVADFMSNLKSSGRFKDIDIVLSRQDLSKTPRTVTFEVSCRFES